MYANNYSYNLITIFYHRWVLIYNSNVSGSHFGDRKLQVSSSESGAKTFSVPAILFRFHVASKHRLNKKFFFFEGGDASKHSWLLSLLSPFSSLIFKLLTKLFWSKDGGGMVDKSGVQMAWLGSWAGVSRCVEFLIEKTDQLYFHYGVGKPSPDWLLSQEREWRAPLRID